MLWLMAMILCLDAATQPASRQTDPPVKLYSKQLDGAQVTLWREELLVENRDPSTKDQYPVLSRLAWTLRLCDLHERAGREVWRLWMPQTDGSLVEPQMLDVAVEEENIIIVFNRGRGCWARVVTGSRDGVYQTFPGKPHLNAGMHWDADIGPEKRAATVSGSFIQGTLQVDSIDMEGNKQVFRLLREREDGRWVLIEDGPSAASTVVEIDVSHEEHRLRVDRDGSGRCIFGPSDNDLIWYPPGSFDLEEAAAGAAKSADRAGLRALGIEAGGVLEYLDVPKDKSACALHLRFADGSRRGGKLSASDETVARLFDQALRANVTAQLAVNWSTSPPAPPDAGVKHEPKAFVHILHRAQIGTRWILTINADGSGRYGYGIDFVVPGEQGNTNVVDLPPQTFDLKKIVAQLANQAQNTKAEELLEIQNIAVLVDYIPQRRVRVSPIPEPLVLELYSQAFAAKTNIIVRGTRGYSELLRRIP